MRNWSEEQIEETLRVWKPYADRADETLSREDAIEILDNMYNFAESLLELSLKEQKRTKINKNPALDVKKDITSAQTD